MGRASSGACASKCSPTGTTDSRSILEDVSFIDAAGLALFRDLASRDVVVLNCSLFAAEQLKAVANER